MIWWPLPSAMRIGARRFAWKSAQLGAGADRDPHGDVGRVGGDRRGVCVGELDVVVGEEVPRVGDGSASDGSSTECSQRTRRPRTGGDDRVARAAEADQAVRELDDVVGRDLERAEAGGLDGDGWTF